MAMYLGSNQVAIMSAVETGGGGGGTYQTKTKTYTPTTSTQTETVSADTGYDALEEVDITVNPIPSSYIIPTGNKSITANGTNIDVAQYATASVAVPSQVVSGTFTTSSSTGTVQSVTIPYTGTGYPLMAMVEVSPDMYDSSTTWSSTVQRYAVGLISMVKPYNSAPTYGTGTGTNNYGHIYTRYKSSTSSATSYTNGGSSTVTVFTSTNPSASSTACIKFSDATTMKVFIATTSYGLMASTLYKYTIVYSA